MTILFSLFRERNPNNKSSGVERESPQVHRQRREERSRESHLDPVMEKLSKQRFEVLVAVVATTKGNDVHIALDGNYVLPGSTVF